MAINLNRLTKGEPDWHIPLNSNAQMMEDALESAIGGGITQGQLDAVQAIAEQAQATADSKFPLGYTSDGTDLDNLTEAGVYGLDNPDWSLNATNGTILVMRGGDDTPYNLNQVAYPLIDDGKAAPMYIRTRINGAWTPWELKTAGAALLWAGNWNSGAITIPDFGKYSGFIITMVAQGTTIPVYRAPNSTHMRGVGGYSSATPSIVTYQFTATVSGETLNFVACNSITHTVSGSHSAATNYVVGSIYGVVLV